MEYGLTGAIGLARSNSCVIQPCANFQVLHALAVAPVGQCECEPIRVLGFAD